MCIPQGDIDRFMTDPLSDSNRLNPFAEQERDMAVTEIMNPDPLDTGFGRSAIHFMVQVAHGNREDPVCFFDAIEHFQIILHLFAETLR